MAMECLFNATTNLSTKDAAAFRADCLDHHNASELIKPALKIHEPSLRIFKLVCYAIVFIVGVLGNSLVVWLVAKRRLRARYNYFLANLAVADLAVVTINLPFRLAYQESNYQWPFGYALCKIIPPLTFTFTTASSAFLMAVSLERYRAVVYPLRGKVTRVQLKVVVIVVWILSFLVTFPLNTFMAIVKHRGKTVCTDAWPSLHLEQVYFVLLFVIQFAFPLIMMLIVYLRIILTMQHNEMKSCNHRASLFIRRRNQRVVRMLLAVVLSYFICVMPYSTFLVLQVFKVHDIPTGIKTFLVLIALANSMVNPLLYGALNRQFRLGYMYAITSLRRNCLRRKDVTLDSIFRAVPPYHPEQPQRARPKKYMMRVMSR